MRVALAALLTGLACAAAPASAGDVSKPQPAPESGKPHALAGDELRQRLSNADIYGCYPATGMTWGERTRDDGVLYDLMNAVRRVGTWNVAGDQVCYHYDVMTAGAASCFTVREEGGDLFFFDPLFETLVATTQCGLETTL